MYDKRNVIVMFLLSMLSFAIITEVSATANDAEIDGTGSSHPIMSVDMAEHDIAGERNDDMQGHVDDFRSYNEQNPFDKTPGNLGDNKSNENLYEHDKDLKPDYDLNETGDFNMFKPNQKPLDFNKSMENFSEFEDEPMFDLKNFTNNFNSPALRDSNFTDVSNRGELMDDIVSKLMGLNNIAPNFKKDGINISSDCQKHVNEKNNASAPIIPGDKNSSDIGSDNINKSTKDLKKDKKSKDKAKNVKKSTKKVKSTKKSKKTNKKLAKKSKKERAKL